MASIEPVTQVLSIGERVRLIAQRVLRIDPQEVALEPHSNLYDLGLESLNVVELITELEQEFEVAFELDELSGELFMRVDQLIDFIASKV